MKFLRINADTYLNTAAITRVHFSMNLEHADNEHEEAHVSMGSTPKGTLIFTFTEAEEIKILREFVDAHL